VKYEIKYKPSYAMLVVNLDQGETITAESGSMTYMSPTIEARTRKREKSFWGTLGLSLIGGQSFWVNDYTATAPNAEAGFVAAPAATSKNSTSHPAKATLSKKAPT
jgi:uncharacterized protein (AIM24 family)